MAKICLSYDDVTEIARMLAALAEIDYKELLDPIREMMESNESDGDTDMIVIDDEGITWDEAPVTAEEETGQE
jgi:hypothetical protein